MVVLCTYHGAYKMLLGNYSPWMDGPVLTLIQLLLLFHLKEEESLNKKKKNPKKQGEKKTTKGN